MKYSWSALGTLDKAQTNVRPIRKDTVVLAAGNDKLDKIEIQKCNVGEGSKPQKFAQTCFEKL